MRRITKTDLCEKVAAAPPNVRNDYGLRALALAGYILREFMGPEWGKRYLHWDSRHAGIFKLPQPGVLGMTRSTFYILDLAETLFNLQRSKGFGIPLHETREAPNQDKVESTYAEFDFARLLHLHRVKFRFRRPRGETQEDYDFELSLKDGTCVCADAKCKLEGTGVSMNSVSNTLRHGYAKLPKDSPGMLFVKVPQHWLESDEIKRELERNPVRLKHSLSL